MKYSKIIFIILTCFIVVGCQQFAPKANYQVENCERTYQWDDKRQRDVITFESCTTSYAQSNRESKSVVLKSNQKTGQLDFTAGELTNAEEAAWAKVLANLLSDPNFLSGMAGAVLNSVSNNRNNDQ